MALLRTNTGIGTTNPTSALHVIGDGLVTGVVTATTFNGNINSGVASITSATITTLNSTNTNLTNINSSGISTLGRVGISSNLVVSGIATFQSNVHLGNNDKIYFGDNNDLEIYYNGSSSVIRDLTGGTTYILGTNVQIGNTTATSDYAIFNGSVQLYNNGSKKFETTGTGVTIFDTLYSPYLNSGVGTITTINSTNASLTRIDNTYINSGIVTATRFSTGNIGSSINITSDSITGPSSIVIDPAAVGDDTGAVRIKGDLYVDGSQFIVNSTTIELADFRVGIATTVGSNVLLDGAGIGIGSANIQKTLTYDYSSDSLKSSENFDLNPGKVYKINEIEVLSSNTLGSGVVYSALQYLGTLNNLNVSGLSTLPTLVGTYATITEIDNTRLISGIATITDLTVTNSSFDNLNVDNIYAVTGIVTDISGQRLNYTGVGTITTLNSSDANITNLDLQTLRVSGLSTFTSGPVIIGSASQTGTQGQTLQVTGGAYISTYVGIGFTDPFSNLAIYDSNGAWISLVDPGQSSSAIENNNGTLYIRSEQGSGNSRIIFQTGTSNYQEKPSISGSDRVEIDSLGNVLINVETPSGITDQKLQVSGGAYISQNTGIGLSNATSRLHVAGDALITGVVTATTFNGDINSALGTITTLSGTNVNYTNSDFVNLNADNGYIVTGIITDIQNSRLTSGIATITTLNSTNNNLTNINATGISTLADIRAQRVTVTGIVTANSFRPTSGYIQAADGTNSFYIYDTTGNVAFQGTIGVNQINNGGGYQVITFNDIDTRLTGNLNVAGVTTSSVFNGNIYSLGVSTFRNGPVLIGTGTSTGTASQPLQVSGGAYISNNLGIGSAIPGSNLDVIGNAYVSGVVTATTFSGNINANQATIANLTNTYLNSGVGTVTSLFSTNADLTNIYSSGISTQNIVRIDTLNVSGITTFQDNVYLGINDVLTLGGNSNYLKIFHDGGAAYIDNDTGILFYNAGQHFFQNSNGSEILASFTENGTAALYFDNIKRIETTGYGVTVYDTVQSPQIYVTGVGTIATLNTTNINSTNSDFVNLNADIANIDVGIVTDISGERLNYTGVGTIAALNSTRATIIDIENTNINNTGIATVANLDVQSSFNVYSVGTFYSDLNIIGNVSIGGTTVILTGDELRIKDKDIVLGVTTNALNQDVSNDNTSNHGGIAVASTEGYPLVNLQVAGINSLPNTYKQIMWVRNGTTGAGTTDAWLINYAVGIGSTQVPNNVRLAVGNVQITDKQINADTAEFIRISSGIATISGADIGNLNSNNIYSQSGIITDLSGTRLNYTGFGTVTNLHSSVAYIDNLASNVAFSTQFSGERLNVTGVGTFANLNATNSQFTNLNATNLYSVSGIVTTLTSTNSNIENINSTGISTLNILRANQINSTGVVTAPTFVGDLLGVANYSHVSGYSTFSGYSNTSGFSTFSGYSNNSGISTYSWTAGVSTYAGVAGYSTFSGYSNTSGFSTFSGYSNTSGFSTFSNYANSAGIATYSSTSGVSTSVIGGIARISELQVSGISTFTNGPVLIGSGTSTGTFNQPLQVTGGGYISTNLGIGSTNAQYLLDVNGDINFNGLLYQNNQPFIASRWTAGLGNDIYRLSQVGIGTTNPEYQLDVLGDVRIRGGIYDPLNNSSGLSNYVIVADGFGGWSWQPVTAAGAGTLDGIEIRDQGNVVGTSGSITTLDFRSNNTNNIVVTGYAGGNIATITLTDDPVFSTLGVLNTSGLGIATAKSLSVSGIVTASQFSTGAVGSGININNNSITGPSSIVIDPAAVGDDTGAVRIKGDLYVDGTQFVVNSTTIELADFRVGIATTVGSNLVLDGAGIGIGSANIQKTLTYDYTNDSLKSSENFNLPSGKTYKINGVDVLSSTTLGSGVINSSLTSVGTLTNLQVSGVTTSSGGFVGNLTGNASSATYANVAGISTYSNNSGISTYSWTAGVSTYAGVAGYSTFSGYSNTSGFSTFSDYANSAGIATYASTTGVSSSSNYANSAGIATYAWTAGVSTYSGVSGFSTFSEYSNNSGISTYSWTAGVSTYSGVAGYSTISKYSDASGFSTFSSYADNSGISTYSWTAGVSTYSGVAGVSTSVVGGVASVTQIQVTGISTFTNGPVLIGSGTSTGTTAQRLQVTGGGYISGNLGVGTTNPQYKLDILGDVNFNGNLFQNGSRFTSGIGIGSTTINPSSGVINPTSRIGIGFTDINFVGTGLSITGYGSTVVIDLGNLGGTTVSISSTPPGISTAAGNLWWDSENGDLKIYYVDANSGQWIDANGDSQSLAIISETSPTGYGITSAGTLWWDSTYGTLKVYYDDGNSTQWVDANSGAYINYWTGNSVGINTLSKVGLGTTTPTEQLQVNGYISIDGNVSYGTTTATTATVSQTVIHSGLPSTIYRSVEYTIQATQGTNFHTTKIIALHDGTLTYPSEYGAVYNNSPVATYDLDISGGLIRLLATPASSSTTNYKIIFDAIKV